MKILHPLLIVFILLIVNTSCNKKTDTATQISRASEKSESAQSRSTVLGDEKEFVIVAKELNEGAEQNHEMFLKIIQQSTGVSTSSYNESKKTFIVPVNDENREQVREAIALLLAQSKNGNESNTLTKERNEGIKPQTYEYYTQYYTQEELDNFKSQCGEKWMECAQKELEKKLNNK